MKLPRLPKNYLRIILPLFALFLILLFIFPRNAKFSYDYRKGSPWNHETLIAQFDFPILKSDEQLREERSANRSVEVPYYVYKEDVVTNSRKAADEAGLGDYSWLRPIIVSSMLDIYSSGVVSDEGVKLSPTTPNPTTAPDDALMALPIHGPMSIGTSTIMKMRTPW